MMKFSSKGDVSRSNLKELIDQMAAYRDMQHKLSKQYDLVLEDPKFDTVYLNIEPLMTYKKYIEADLNGTAEHSSTTQIIKEFKKLLESYDYNVENYQNTDFGIKDLKEDNMK